MKSGNGTKFRGRGYEDPFAHTKGRFFTMATNGNRTPSNQDGSNDTHTQKRGGEVLFASAKALDSFQEDVSYLWCFGGSSSIPIYDHPPSTVDFLRQHVAMSRPCIIRNAIPSFPPVTVEDLLDQAPSHLIMQVDVTPDGHGDCLRQTTVQHAKEQNTGGDNQNHNNNPVFVKPMPVKMSLATFAKHLQLQRPAAKQQHNEPYDQNEEP